MSKENVGELVEKKEQCCGCGLCVYVCPVCVITMVEDVKGFRYPNVDNSKCIGCSKCVNMCRFKKRKNEEDRNSNIS